jgi:hypothetical protein
MRRRALASAALALAAALAAGASRADDTKMACVRAYEDGQTLKRSGKLRAARDALALCKSGKCPDALRGDCKTWWKEVDDSLPTLVIGARTKDGRDLVDVRVAVDGEPLAKKIDGWAVSVDPGVHVLRFEADGFVATEVRVVAKEGEKRRNVDAVLEPIAAPKPVVVAPEVEAPRRDEEPKARPVPTLAYVFGATGVVAIGAFGYFAATGLSQKSDLDKCKPNCSQDDVDSAKRSFLIGDVALGVGVVAIGAAAYLYFTRSSEPRTSARVDVTPTRGGAFATFGASF